MHQFHDPAFWAAWLRIIVIDILLAGDNALVIALAVRTLGPREQFYGRIFGSLGAVVLRVLFIVAVTWVLQLPLVRVVGGVLLLGIAVRLLRPEEGKEEAVRPGSSLRQAIGIIILADVVMSLDNVLAIAAAAKGDVLLAAFGLLFSLPLVVWGSGLLATLLNRWPVLVWAGAGVLGWVAVKLSLDDPWSLRWVGGNAAVIHGAPLAVGVVLFALGAWLARKLPKPLSTT